MKRRSHAYVLTVLVAVTLAGCSDDSLLITEPQFEGGVRQPEALPLDPCIEGAAATAARLPELPEGCDDPNAEPAVV